MKRIVCIVFLLMGVLAMAQEPTGKWSGTLAVNPVMKLKMLLDVKASDGGYTSNLTSISQSSMQIPASATSVVGDSLFIELSSIGANYSAAIGDTLLSGTFLQKGMSFPLNLVRVSEEELEAKNERPQTPVRPFPYREEVVQFYNRVEGNMLHGTLSAPRGAEKCNAVVLISGSGAQDRDCYIMGHYFFLVLSDYLVRNGVAVLRYDDRGVGNSPKVENDGTTADLAYDAEAGVEYLRSCDKFDKVGVIGHSEGGMIAFMLSGGDNYIAPDFMVSMAGTGVRGDEVLNYQQEYALKSSGINPISVAFAMNLNKKIYSTVLESVESNEALKDSIVRIVRGGSVGADSLTLEKRIAEITKTVMNPWMYYFLRYDPREAIRGTKCPVLALNGTLDRQVSAEDNLASIEKELSEGGNKDYTIKYCEGLNHLFQKCETGSVNEYSEIQETINEEVLETIAEWIKTIK